MLDENKNYIVSGLERSGTSLMMQILEAGEIPVAYDNSRKSDKSNKMGYFELEGGKIISTLAKAEFPMDDYFGRFIKITSYGIQFLPMDGRKYEVIYMIRNMDEIIESSIQMGAEVKNKEEMRTTLEILQLKALQQICTNPHISYQPIYYNRLLKKETRKNELEWIKKRYSEFDMEAAEKVIDESLYRSRRK